MHEEVLLAPSKGAPVIPARVGDLKPGDSAWIKPNFVHKTAAGEILVNPDADVTLYPHTFHNVLVYVTNGGFELDLRDCPVEQFDATPADHWKGAIDRKNAK